MTRAAVLRTAAMCAIAAVVSALIGAPAWAGTYQVRACSPFTNAGPWSGVDTFPAGLSVGEMCGGSMVGPLGGGNEGALYAQDNTQNATSIPNGARAGWSFAAPTGTLITSVSYYRDLEIYPTSDNFVVGLFEGDGTPLETCQGTFANSYTCSVPNNQVPASFSGLSTTGLFFGIECHLQPSEEDCVSGSSGHQLVRGDMYSVAVTLSEESTPTVSAEGGSLWGGGVVSGTVPLSFDAIDPSGIQGVTVDDGPAVGASARESCDFTQAVPCPQLQAGTLDVETAHFADGRGQITLSVTDAAANTTVATSAPLVVDNNGPPAPSSLTASAVGAGSRVVDLAWSDPVNPPEPVSTGYAQLCQASCAAPIAVSGAGAAQVTAPGPGSYTVRLWLIDSAGKGGPQNAATTALTVPPAPPAGGGPTGSHGHTSHRLRLRARRRRHRLIVTVDTPAATHGDVLVRLYALHGKRLRLIARREARPHRGVARTVFLLRRRLLQAPRLVLRASARGATAARLTVRRPRR
jgi:hypothetical protein